LGRGVAGGAFSRGRKPQTSREGTKKAAAIEIMIRGSWKELRVKGGMVAMSVVGGVQSGGGGGVVDEQLTHDGRRASVAPLSETGDS